MQEKIEGIAVPKDLLEEFKNLRSANLNDDETGDGQPAQLDEFSFKMLKKFFTWLGTSFDNSMKSKGAPGLDAVNIDDLVELGMLAHEEMLTAKMAEDLPKYTFYATLFGIMSQNAIALKKAKKVESKKEEKKADEKSGE